MSSKDEIPKWGGPQMGKSPNGEVPKWGGPQMGRSPKEEFLKRRGPQRRMFPKDKVPTDEISKRWGLQRMRWDSPNGEVFPQMGRYFPKWGGFSPNGEVPKCGGVQMVRWTYQKAKFIQIILTLIFTLGTFSTFAIGGSFWLIAVVYFSQMSGPVISWDSLAHTIFKRTMFSHSSTFRFCCLGSECGLSLRLRILLTSRIIKSVFI